MQADFYSALAPRRSLGSRLRGRAGGVGRLGDVPPTVGGTVQGLYAGANQQVQTEIAATLQGLNVNTTDVGTALTAYSQIGSGAVGAVQAFASGNTLGGINAIIPLIGAGLAATGVGAPAVAVVVGGIYLVETALTSLGLFGGPTQIVSCHWAIPLPAFGSNQGAICFNGPRTYGPLDASGNPNPNWLTLEQFQSGQGPSAISWSLVQATQGGWSPVPYTPDPTSGGSWANVTFTWWGGVGNACSQGQPLTQCNPGSLVRDMWALGIDYPGKDLDAQQGSQISQIQFASLINQAALVNNLPPAQNAGDAAAAAAMIWTNLTGFVTSYEKCLMRAAEYALNNFQTIDPIALLVAHVLAWNAVHDSSVTYTFGDYQNTGTTLIDAICAGSATGQGWPPVTVNLGPTPVSPIHLPPGGIRPFPVNLGGGIGGTGGGAPKSTSSSTAGTVVVLLLLGGAAAGGYYYYRKHPDVFQRLRAGRGGRRR